MLRASFRFSSMTATLCESPSIRNYRRPSFLKSSLSLSGQPLRPTQQMPQRNRPPRPQVTVLLMTLSRLRSPTCLSSNHLCSNLSQEPRFLERMLLSAGLSRCLSARRTNGMPTACELLRRASCRGPRMRRSSSGWVHRIRRTTNLTRKCTVLGTRYSRTTFPKATTSTGLLSLLRP